jgi:hypothetical protein
MYFEMYLWNPWGSELHGLGKNNNKVTVGQAPNVIGSRLAAPLDMVLAT